MLALSLVLGGGFFCGCLVLELLLDGGCFYKDIINSLEALCASFRELRCPFFCMAMLCIYTIIDGNYT